MIRGRGVTKSGLESGEGAKDNGMWAEAFANSYKTAYLHRVLREKRPETRAQRIREAVARAAENTNP